jgi:hypothetical protein
MRKLDAACPDQVFTAQPRIHVGRTVGRGKKSRVHQQIIPIKDIWLYPLHKAFRSVLGRS